MRQLSTLVPLPPEIRQIIQSYLDNHLRQTKFNSIKSRIQSKLYFWLHIEDVYIVDYYILPFMDFTDFRPVNTPVGILRLPVTAYIHVPITII
jgi:hypothetical protein